MNKYLKLLLIAAVSLGFLLAGLNGDALALTVGSSVSSLKIKDANNNPAWIPNVGKKVLTIFYADPDASDVNDPLADSLKAMNYDKSKYQGMGIANCADTWKPNAAIRFIIRRKIKKYNSTILTDTDKTVAKKWNLGNCNDYSVVIVIGKDKKVKFIKKVNSKSQSRAIITEVLNIVSQEVNK